MDFKRAFEVVTGRIKELEPQEVAMRIMGFLLLQCKDEEMIRLAHVPDHAIENVVHNAKNELGRLASNPLVSPVIDIPPQFSSFSNRGLSSPIAIEKPMPNWDACVSHLNGSPLSHHDALAELRAKTQCMSLGNGYEQGGLGNFSSDEAFGNISGQISRRSPASPDFPIKQCHFFRRGFCKYGNSCPYSHEQVSPGSILPIFPPGADHFVNDESLERLEMDIIKLLKMRGGGPIPISTLPGMFSDTYGRPLQADGYLTESQRNGKAGYGLSKLLARLKNSICVIDRPHGQHSIILAEDVLKYLEYRSGRNGPGPIVSGSRQIYLTFPAESSFTEDDVAEYFSEFGTVVDVRMPCHQERMFGFVSFSSPDTVTTILSKPNPHFVSGSRVLVKPYREKPKLPNRRFTEDPVYYSQPYAADLDYEFLPRIDAARLFRKQLMEEYVRGLDLQNSMGFQLARNAVFPLPGNHDHLPDSPTNQFTIDHAANHSGHINTASESSAQENGLPDSPFSSHYQEVLPQPAQHNHGKSEELIERLLE